MNQLLRDNAFPLDTDVTNKELSKKTRKASCTFEMLPFKSSLERVLKNLLYSGEILTK